MNKQVKVSRFCTLNDKEILTRITIIRILRNFKSFCTVM